MKKSYHLTRNVTFDQTIERNANYKGIIEGIKDKFQDVLAILINGLSLYAKALGYCTCRGRKII